MTLWKLNQGVKKSINFFIKKLIFNRKVGMHNGASIGAAMHLVEGPKSYNNIYQSNRKTLRLVTL